MDYFRRLHLNAFITTADGGKREFLPPDRKITLRYLANLFAHNSPYAYYYFSTVYDVCRYLSVEELDTQITLITNAFSNDVDAFAELDLDTVVLYLLQMSALPRVVSSFCYHYCKLAVSRQNTYAEELIHHIMWDFRENSQQLAFRAFYDVDFEQNMICAMGFLAADYIDQELYAFICECTQEEATASAALTVIESLLRDSYPFVEYFTHSFQWHMLSIEQLYYLVLENSSNQAVIKAFFENLSMIVYYMSSEDAVRYLQLISAVLNVADMQTYIQVLDCLNGLFNEIQCGEDAQEYIKYFVDDYGVNLIQ